MNPVYIEMVERTADEEQRREYLMKEAGIFETVDEVFDEGEVDTFYWRMRQGRFYHENLEWLEGVEITDIIDAFTDAFEIDIDRFVEEGVGYYIRVLLSCWALVGERE